MIIICANFLSCSLFTFSSPILYVRLISVFKIGPWVSDLSLVAEVEWILLIEFLFCYQFCSEGPWCWWLQTPAVSQSCSALEPSNPVIPSHSTSPEDTLELISCYTVCACTHAHVHTTLSCWTFLCRPSVVRLPSLACSWFCAVCSHLRREPERPRNCSSCCSQAWIAADLGE